MEKYSREMLRALGLGVSRLNDGDLKDRSDADKVVAEMVNVGYLLDGEMFLTRNQIFVNSHMHPKGACFTDISDSDREYVIQSLGALLAEIHDMISVNMYLDLPEVILQAMASSLTVVRHEKGIRYEPEWLTKQFERPQNGF